MSEPRSATVPQRLWRDIKPTQLGSADGTAGVRVLTDADPGDQPIDADIVILTGTGEAPAPGLAAAHARWHHAVADVVSLGSLAPDSDPGEDTLGLVIDLTRDLTDLGGGIHLAAAEGSIGVRRELLEAAGGIGDAPAHLRRLDVLQRLHNAGAVFVSEPAALAHGPGSGLARAVADGCRSDVPLEFALPEAAGLAAMPPLRSLGSIRRHARPAVAVNLNLAGATPSEAIANLRATLSGRLGDLEARVQGDDLDPAVVTAVDADPRAQVAPSSLADAGCQAPIQITVPPLAALDLRTLADLHELAFAEEAGALHVTVPGASPQEAMIEVVATGAHRRANRLAATSGEDPAAIIGRLYGERWVSGVEVSTRRHGVDEPQVTEHGPLAAATDIDLERKNHLRFRERANDMAERAAILDRRTLAERLKAREVRQAAERIESRLSDLPPRNAP